MTNNDKYANKRIYKALHEAVRKTRKADSSACYHLRAAYLELGKAEGMALSMDDFGKAQHHLHNLHRVKTAVENHTLKHLIKSSFCP